MTATLSMRELPCHPGYSKQPLCFLKGSLPDHQGCSKWHHRWPLHNGVIWCKNMTLQFALVNMFHLSLFAITIIPSWQAVLLSNKLLLLHISLLQSVWFRTCIRDMQWYAPCTLEKKTKKKKIPWPSSTVNKENAVYPLLAKKWTHIYLVTCGGWYIICGFWASAGCPTIISCKTQDHH
jgi:hypothetical protein